jgi:hypothetical protein
MLRKRIFRRILFGPAKRITGTLANIVVFDIAMTIYRYLKKESRTEGLIHRMRK